MDNNSTRPLIVLDQVWVREGSHPILKDVSLTILQGQFSAIVGPMGSGKSTLAEVLTGKRLISSGSIAWPIMDRIGENGRTVTSPSDLIKLVSFKEQSRLFSYGNHYYQQRFEFADADQPLTLQDFLKSGTNASDSEIGSAARQLRIEEQLMLSFIKLSNGQTRRARIARAMLAKPELLILDDPFMGVDRGGRAELNLLLEQLFRSGLSLVLICQREMIPSWVTNLFECGQSPRESRHHRTSVSGNAPSLNPTKAETIIELRNVTVSYAGKSILSGINWKVQAGERWAITGPNGSGKTTLLSLLCGDHPQAYSNEIFLFGQRRGSGETIWDVKRRVGLISPELHLYFTTSMTAEGAATTGFSDTLIAQAVTENQFQVVQTMFEEFGITTLAKRPYRNLSTGEQQLVLLVRALVKRPQLLILDEPFQGLDAIHRVRVRNWLDNNLDPDQTLLFVSHHLEELPNSITYHLELESSRVVSVKTAK